MLRWQFLIANDLLDAPGVTNTAGLAQATAGSSGAGAAPGAEPVGEAEFPPPHAASKPANESAVAALNIDANVIAISFKNESVFLAQRKSRYC